MALPVATDLANDNKERERERERESEKDRGRKSELFDWFSIV